MDDYIAQIKPEDDELEEEWLRSTGEAELNVSACKIADEAAWQVTIWAMEYVRSEPLEGELRHRITQALQGVSGVSGAEEQDGEQWWVEGSPTGRALVAAAALVIDEFADRIRAYLSGLY